MTSCDFKALEDNLIYVAQETIIKMGGDEPVGLYYPASTLRAILGVSEKEPLIRVLGDFSAFAGDRLGDIKIVEDGERYRITLGKKALGLAREGLKDCSFLKDLIGYSASYPADIGGLTAVFYKYSDKVACKRCDGEEFDYLVFFEGGEPDGFYYCVKFEEGEMHYHRLAPADFRARGFKE